MCRFGLFLIDKNIFPSERGVHSGTPKIASEIRLRFRLKVGLIQGQANFTCCSDAADVIATVGASGSVQQRRTMRVIKRRLRHRPQVSPLSLHRARACIPRTASAAHGKEDRVGLTRDTKPLSGGARARACTSAGDESLRRSLTRRRDLHYFTSLGVYAISERRQVSSRNKIS